MRQVIGSVFIGVGIVVFIFPAWLFWTRPDLGDSWQSIVFSYWFVASFIIHVGRRLVARKADAAREDDPRPPVLYLRPFQRDLSDNIRMLVRMLTRNKELGGESPEEELIKQLGDIGPVIALGRPGEWAAPIGAARMYVTEGTNWKDNVRSLLRDAQLVVVRGSGTAGLLWEIREITTTVDPSKVKLVFDTPNDYQHFYEWAWPLFPAGLPEEFPGYSVTFEQDWSHVGTKPKSTDRHAPNVEPVEPAVPSPRSPLSPMAGIMVGGTTILLNIALSLAITADARSQVQGLLFAIVLVLIVLALCIAEDTFAMVAMELNTRGLLSLGLHIEPSTSTIETALSLTKASKYVLPEHMEALFNRASATESLLEARRVAEMEADANQAADPDDNPFNPLSLRLALNIVGRADMLSARIASIGILAVAVLGTAVASDRVSLGIMMLIAIGSGFAAGLMIVRWLCRGPIVATYWTTEELVDLNCEDRSILDLVNGKPVRVMVQAERSCCRLLALRILQFSALALNVHLTRLLPIVFGGAWLTMLLWPGVEPAGVGYWASAIGSIFLGGITYVASGWLGARSASLFMPEPET